MKTALALSALVATAFAQGAVARLPPPSVAEVAEAAQAKAKTGWSDKVAAYKLCVAIDRTAEAYRKSVAAAGRTPPVPMDTQACVDPGPYAAPSPKPLEASGAHSPAETAVAPPSSKATHAEIEGARK